MVISSQNNNNNNSTNSSYRDVCRKRNELSKTKNIKKKESTSAFLVGKRESLQKHGTIVTGVDKKKADEDVKAVAEVEEVDLAADDGFTLVVGQRRRGQRGKRNHVRAVNLDRFEDLNDPHAWANQKIGKLKKDIRMEGKQFLETLSEVMSGVMSSRVGTFNEFYCLGLGRLSTRNASLQAALSVLMLDDMEELFSLGDNQIVSYDPLFDKTSRQGLEKLGFCVLDDNQEGLIHSAESNALFFMPHCPVFLYNNIIKANWTMEKLGRVVIIGNSLNGYAKRGNQELQNMECLNSILPYLSEVKLPPFDHHSSLESAFIDTSIHWVTEKNLRKAKRDGVLLK